MDAHAKAGSDEFAAQMGDEGLKGFNLRVWVYKVQGLGLL